MRTQSWHKPELSVRSNPPAVRRVAAAARCAVEMLEDRRLFSAGDLDPAFGLNGIRLTDGPTIVNPENVGRANAVAIHADGKIVSVGGALDDTDGFEVFRYNANGSTDAGFGANGVVRFGLPGSQGSAATDVVIQPDGKIVVAGYGRYGGNERFAALRFLPSGQLDSTFSGDGIATADFGTGDDRALGVALQSNGKVVLAGYTNGGEHSDIAVVRLTASGSADTTFSGDGKQTVDIAGGREDQAAAVLVGSDGKVTVGGFTVNAAGNRDFALARLTSAGSLDATFDGDGKRTLDFEGGNDFINDIAPAPGNTIVAAGGAEVDHPIPGDSTHEEYINADAALARFTTSGALDKTFSGDGKLTTVVGDEFGTFEEWGGVKVLSDGRVVVGGTSERTASGSWIAARFHGNGTPDASFGESNRNNTFSRDFIGDSDIANDIAVQSDGRVVLVGTRELTYQLPDGGSDFSIARLTTAGKSDATFARGSALAGRLEGVRGGFSSVATTPDGKLLAAGVFITLDQGISTDDYNFPAFGVARFNANGALDLGFGDKGLAALPVGTAFSEFETITDVIPLASGKFLVAATRFRRLDDQGHRESDLYVARLNANGSVDTSFGTGGLTTIDFGGDERIGGLAVTANGSIFVAGSGGSDLVLAKLTSAGLPDGSFSGDGKLTVAGDTVVGVAADSSGRPVVATEDALLRFTTAGQPDASFGSGGSVSVASVTDVVVDTSGRPVVAFDDGSGAFEIRRYTTGGQPDGAFGAGGTATVSFSGNNAASTTLALQANGRIVVAGSATSTASASAPRLVAARLTSGGQIDTTYGGGVGRTVNNVPVGTLFEAHVTSLALDADGRPVIGGFVADPAEFVVRQTSFLARYQGDDAAGTLALNGATGELRINGTSAADSVQISRSGSNLLVRLNGAQFSFSNTAVKSLYVDARGGDDVVQIAAGVTAAANIHGGDGNDTLTGGDGQDVISGEAGNDTLDGGKGKDRLVGAEGNDTLLAKDGVADFLDGGIGTDKAKKDSIDSTSGVEQLI